ncbi:phosphoglucosamine mutase [Candidatus Riesia pediculicola]|uniref:Phosphoglucosamine mutase n=1 Tax=Riesia pediculicola (strain USDA) TaxID=515618 RepID=D4G869_RIEPU|nr:phosphoglucosamine mutase [Candidatus Riesia pediculicola]ADD79674.1 phosphoglucosamine mutase [Candidatus Riesia pediculicola USDA]ARC53772.1 hypothetical protein AOE55_01235 [Candidatus Riesia pediculicola]QOJ86410.1 phosphoglucosamine mutase [Candidatus Riesia pediculicola]
MRKNSRYFGTDGIRGKFGEYPITPNFFLKLGYIIGKFFFQQGIEGIILGRDTRISGQILKSSMKSGILSSGLSFYDAGLMSTPAIAFLTKVSRKKIGVSISGSHNQYYDNGIKVFSKNGMKICKKVEYEIEDKIRNFSKETITCYGKSKNIKNAERKYIEFCKDFSERFDLIGLKIVLNCSNGATYKIAPCIFQELGANVISVDCKPDGMNIHHKDEEESLFELKKKVIEKKAHLGILLDGDGDRVSLVDHLGNHINGDQIIYIIVKDSISSRINSYKGGVIGTTMSNTALEKEFKKIGVPFIRSEVGEKNVLEKMKENGWIFGAESSGHVILLDQSTTSDGIIAALRILKIMIKNHTNLFRLCNEFRLMPQIFMKIKFNQINNKLILKNLMKMVQSIQKKISRDGRVIIRESGTEKLIRIMVEGNHQEDVLKIAQEIKLFSKERLNNIF